MGILSVIGICLFCLYIAITTWLFFIPESLSSSYYLWKTTKSPFRFFLIATSLLLAAPMIALGKGNIWQFTGFLTPACLMFVGVAADFKNRKLVDRWVHPLCAIICAISSIIWLLYIVKMPIFLLTSFIICSIIAFVTGTLKKSYVFWLEMACFLSIFCCLIKIYYF